MSLRRTVNLDDQPYRMTIKVGNVRAHRMLTTKLEAVELAITKTCPEFFLRGCRFLAHCSCARQENRIQQHFWICSHSSSPRPLTPALSQGERGPERGWSHSPRAHPNARRWRA